jgi:hypothetical protein
MTVLERNHNRGQNGMVPVRSGAHVENCERAQALDKLRGRIVGC